MTKGTAPHRPTVLVVNDHEGMLWALGLALRRQGFTVLPAAGGHEAVALYRRRGRKNIDVVLLDVEMPGLDGPWTLIALQAIDPQVRCCFLNTSTSAYDADLLRAMGASWVLPASFHVEEVGVALRGLLDSSGEPA